MVTSVAAIISRHPETIATEIDGEVMLMSLITGRTFGLDKRASRIWALLERPHLVDELVEALLKQYETTAEKCREDVLAFIERMAENQLATVSEPPVADGTHEA